MCVNTEGRARFEGHSRLELRVREGRGRKRGAFLHRGVELLPDALGNWLCPPASGGAFLPPARLRAEVLTRWLGVRANWRDGIGWAGLGRAERGFGGRPEGGGLVAGEHGGCALWWPLRGVASGRDRSRI